MNDSTITVMHYGRDGSFSSQAASVFFKQNARCKIKLLSSAKFKEVFLSVNNATVDYGVVPLENSVAGSVYENYDYFDLWPVSIVGELILRVEQKLLTIDAKVKPGELTHIYSHPKALEQCSSFLEGLDGIKLVANTDTAQAAQSVAEAKNYNFAAIGSKELAAKFNLHALELKIEDNANNFTRFVILAAQHKANSLGSKVSLRFSLPHRAGSLAQVLSLCAQRSWNLTKIESRPEVGTSFNYRFFCDLENVSESTDQLVSHLKPATLDLRFLGRYQPASITEK